MLEEEKKHIHILKTHWSENEWWIGLKKKLPFVRKPQCEKLKQEVLQHKTRGRCRGPGLENVKWNGKCCETGMDTRVGLKAKRAQKNSRKTARTRRTTSTDTEVPVVGKQKQVPAAQGKKSIETLH